jgi:NitT/TauT family transport system substrate-binding protein
MLVGNREFVRKNPVATKRAVRAILKATDLCDSEPERAARAIVDRGFADRYDFLRQTLNDYLYKSANTMPKTLSGSTRCGCRKWA